jgi:TolB protein
MLQWVLRIIVIASVLGFGTGHSSGTKQREIDVDPVTEENLTSAEPPTARSISAEGAVTGTEDRDPQKADPAPGHLKKTKDTPGKTADPSPGGPEKDGSQSGALPTAPDETGAGKNELAPAGDHKEIKHDRPANARSGANDQKPEPGAIEPLYVQAFTEISPGHNDSNPMWSPSGQLIAFERSIGDKREIIVARSDGSVVQKIYCRLSDGDDDMQFFLPGIIDDVSYNAGLSWSPAERSLVFMSNGGSGNYDLYLLPELGAESTVRLTEHSEKDSHPHWSPVANRLVFVSGRTGSAEIYTMDLADRKVIQLTQGEKTYLYPRWSPDGKKIVMIYGSNENHDVYLIEDIDRPAESMRALTTWPFDDLRPVWSPDGTRIAFYSNYNLENNPKLWSIVVIAADGSNATAGQELAQKIIAVNVIPDIERGPAWTSDSKKIVYVKNNERSYNPIYIADIETRTDLPINTGTKMNHDVVCSSNGLIAFRAQVEQWDHIYIAKLKPL